MTDNESPEPIVTPPPVAPPMPPQYAAHQPAGAFDNLIPTKNLPALLAYYFSVFSLIPCAALLLSPAAIVFGIRGLRACHALPGLPGKAHAWVGIILGTITLIPNLCFLLVFLLGSSMNWS